MARKGEVACTVGLPTEDAQLLDRLAAERGIPRAELMRQLLRPALARAREGADPSPGELPPPLPVAQEVRASRRDLERLRIRVARAEACRRALEALRRLTRGYPGQAVPLATLRAHLGDEDERQVVDDVLLELAAEGTVTLYPPREGNLSAADAAAAVAHPTRGLLVRIELR